VFSTPDKQLPDMKSRRLPRGSVPESTPSANHQFPFGIKGASQGQSIYFILRLTDEQNWGVSKEVV
jgi:hypothetical protein